MRKSILVLCCVALVVGLWAMQASADRPAGPRILLEKYLEVTPTQWKAMSLEKKKAATRALDREQRTQFRRDLATAKAAKVTHKAATKAEKTTRSDRAKTAGTRLPGTIKYDTGPAIGAFITGNFKGNRFDVAATTGGAVLPVQAPGTITQVSAYVLPAPPTGSPTWTSQYDAEFRILGAATGGAAGGAAPVLLSNTSGSGPVTGTQTLVLPSPVTFPGPSFHVGVRDDPGWTYTWTSSWTSTWTNTYTNTYTNTFTNTTASPTMWTTMSYYTYTTTSTSMVTTYTYYGYTYAAPGYVTGTTLGQGLHAVQFTGAGNVTPMPAFNMMVRATGNVIVPVELMRFVVE